MTSEGNKLPWKTVVLLIVAGGLCWMAWDHHQQAEVGVEEYKALIALSATACGGGQFLATYVGAHKIVYGDMARIRERLHGLQDKGTCPKGKVKSSGSNTMSEEAND